MNSIPVVPQSDTNYKLYYLVPLAFVYLFHQFGDQLYLYFALIALLGASTRHVMGEALFGPDGEEKAALPDHRRRRRLATIIYKDKPPSKYSGTSWWEIAEEGEIQSRIWLVIIIVIGALQVLFSIMFVLAVYEFYTHRYSIDFIGGAILFSLIALVVYGSLRELLPNASRMDQIDHKLNDIAKEISSILYADDISVSSIAYEAAEGGVFRIDCEVDYEFSEDVTEDLDRVAMIFPSVLSQSPYPICQGEITLTTPDNVDIEMQVDPIWCRQLLNGDMSAEYYLGLVHQTVSVSGSAGDSVESLSWVKDTDAHSTHG